MSEVTIKNLKIINGKRPSARVDKTDQGARLVLSTDVVELHLTAGDWTELVNDVRRKLTEAQR